MHHDIADAMLEDTNPGRRGTWPDLVHRKEATPKIGSNPHLFLVYGVIDPFLEHWVITFGCYVS